VAASVHRRYFEPAAHRVDRLDLGADVIVPDDVGHGLVCGLPRNHENGDPLLHRPAHEAFRRVEIEDVEAVDPWREDHQRHFQHLFGHRAVLDQLEQRRFMHDLAGGDGNIAAEFEGAVVGMGQLAPL
jgi:hypothetical protein